MDQKYHNSNLYIPYLDRWQRGHLALIHIRNNDPPFRVFQRVVLPLIAPALAAGWLLAFTLSLDDLVIASFTTGPGATTLPMLIFSKVRLGVSPDVNALATIIVLAVGFAVAIAAAVMFRTSRRQD